MLGMQTPELHPTLVESEFRGLGPWNLPLSQALQGLGRGCWQIAIGKSYAGGSYGLMLLCARLLCLVSSFCL